MRSFTTKQVAKQVAKRIKCLHPCLLICEKYHIMSQKPSFFWHYNIYFTVMQYFFVTLHKFFYPTIQNVWKISFFLSCFFKILCRSISQTPYVSMVLCIFPYFFESFIFCTFFFVQNAKQPLFLFCALYIFVTLFIYMLFFWQKCLTTHCLCVTLWKK